MDKKVIFAVAGSGKTSHIINSINEESKSLIVTYTDNNTRHLKNKIIKKFGKIPNGIKVYSYFSFLYSFCYRPLCGYELNTKGISYTKTLPKHIQRSKKNEPIHYIDSNKRLYSNRIAKLLIEFNIIPDVINRIESFFDSFYIDEVQDFASSDFNFITSLVAANLDILYVGDFFQHTFDTSRDGNIQKNLHQDFSKYRQKLKKSGLAIDTGLLARSHRCSPNICSFISDKLKILIDSHRTDSTKVQFIKDAKEVESIFNSRKIVKLFYQQSYSYPGFTDNWGNTKGLDDFNDVCVVLNPTTFKAYQNDNLESLTPTTKNKLYVACTRAKGDLYFIEESQLKKFKSNN